MRLSQAEVKTLRSDYLEAFPACQYSPVLKPHVSLPRHFQKGLCVEHIWNRKSHLSEHWSNYATVASGPHDWKHANSVEARIAISWLKWRLSRNDPRHFDRAALRELAGFDVPGWIEVKLETVELPTWCWEMGKELIEAF